jgi:hypothetical protein
VGVIGVGGLGHLAVRFLTLDLQGYRMGSHNEVLGKKALPVVG